jgi:Right handed beta helix region
MLFLGQTLANASPVPPPAPVNLHFVNSGNGSPGITAQPQNQTVAAGPSYAVAVYYVSTSGSNGNTGLSPDSPWPLRDALSQVGPSNVITLLPGTYPSITVLQPGTTLRSQVKWAAKVIGSPKSHGIYVACNSVTIDGLDVSGSAIDGIKIDGSHATVRNCWVHRSTRQGIAIHNQPGAVVEYNLIENNGTRLTQDHGISINGTNNIIRGNVIRYNCAWGMQDYDDVGDCKDTLIYNNLIYANQYGGLTVWSRAGFTNYVFNNTIVQPNSYCLVADYGCLAVTNNILFVFGSVWNPPISAKDGAAVWPDYNVVSKLARPRGSHDVVASRPGFVNSGNGLYWLTATSPARGMANPAIILPVDFFGNSHSPVRDVGALQYSDACAGDTRMLDPSPVNPDYWLTIPVNTP